MSTGAQHPAKVISTTSTRPMSSANVFTGHAQSSSQPSPSQQSKSTVNQQANVNYDQVRIVYFIRGYYFLILLFISYFIFCRSLRKLDYKI